MGKTVRKLAVIDLGSNTTKLTVLSDNGFDRLHRSARYTRLGKGLRDGGELQPDAISRTVEAIGELVDEAERFVPEHYEVVATSAVREACNGSELVNEVKERLGLDVRVLSGLQEANYIVHGVGTDPVLSDLSETFTLVDLGGGSLEAIESVSGDVKQIISLPLGAVRLTEKHMKDPEDIIPFQDIDHIFAHTQEVVKASGFDFKRASQPLVGTGGAFVVARAMLAARQKRDLRRSRPMLQAEELGMLLTEMSACAMEERSQMPGMSPERADIMPAALAVLLAIADMNGASTFIHSYHNLPYGIAREWFSQEG